MNKMKSLHLLVKGVGGLSLTFSEAFGVVIVVAMVSAIVSSLYRCRYHLWCQGFVSQCRGIKYRQSQSLKVSVFVRVSWCQGVRVHCKNMGVIIGEFTLLLDFKRLIENIDSLVFKCVCKKAERERFVYRVNDYKV
jgi:hypothetical protein